MDLKNTFKCFFLPELFNCNALWSLFAILVSIDAHWSFTENSGNFLGRWILEW